MLVPFQTDRPDSTVGSASGTSVPTRHSRSTPVPGSGLVGVGFGRSCGGSTGGAAFPGRHGRGLRRTVRGLRARRAGGFRRVWQTDEGWRPGSSTIFDQGGAISVEPRINERIRVPDVRLVGPNGEQVGIVRIEDALRLAQESDLDLVEVAPMAKPPVCKLMDFGKFKYESAMKLREDRKKQVNTIIKEMKLRPKIDPHDYETKKGHVVRFLKQGDKVKITIMFRGREQSRPELGYRLLQRLAGDVEDLGFVESAPKQDGRNMIMVLGPHRKKTEAKAAMEAEKQQRAAEDAAEREADTYERPPQSAPGPERPVDLGP